MAGKSNKTEVITLRVPVGQASEWRTEADASGVALGAFIVGRAQAVPVLHRQIEELNAAGDSAREALVQARSDIEGFKAARDTYLDKITRADARIGELERVNAEMTDLLENAVALSTRQSVAATERETEIADLKKLVDAHATKIAKLKDGMVRAAGPSKALAAFRSDPKMKAIDHKVHHPAGPVMKSAVPDVAGDTEWCGLKGQDKAKGQKA